MLVSLEEVGSSNPAPPFEPLTPALITQLAIFVGLEIRHCDTLHKIAQMLHMRRAAYTSPETPETDYTVILNEVLQHDPCAIRA